MHRNAMRTDVVCDEYGYLRAACLAHADCRAQGKMVEPPGKKGRTHKPHDLFRKIGKDKPHEAIFRLNENFTRHLKRRDIADGTNLSVVWRTTDKIHGPEAIFLEKDVSTAPLPWCKDVVVEGATEAATQATDANLEAATQAGDANLEADASGATADVVTASDDTGRGTGGAESSLVSALYDDESDDETTTTDAAAVLMDLAAV